MSNKSAELVSRTDYTPWRDAATVRHFYVDKGYSLKETGEVVGCAECTVLQWCRKHGVETRDPQEARDTGTPEDFKDESRMRELYLTLELTCAEIADEYGVSDGCVSKWLRRHDIPTRSANARRNRVERKCPNCDSLFETTPTGTKYCSQSCYFEDLDMPTGEDHWSYSRVEIECENCAEVFTVANINSDQRKYCSRSCFTEDHDFVSGEDHPCWNENRRYRQNGKLWKRTRRDCRARDGYQCQICGVDEPDDQQHDVHHLIPVRYFEDSADAHTLGNVVTLCRSCHMQWEQYTPFLPCVVP